MKAKLKIDQPVTAWNNPSHFKYNTGQAGIVKDVIEHPSKPTKYIVELENGEIILESKYLASIV